MKLETNGNNSEASRGRMQQAILWVLGLVIALLTWIVMNQVEMKTQISQVTFIWKQIDLNTCRISKLEDSNALQNEILTKISTALDNHLEESRLRKMNKNGK
jgi:hypothetical protein